MKKHLFILSIAMASLVACTATEKKPSNFAEGTTSLPRATAEEVNVSQESIDKLFSLIEAEDQEFHSLMILRNGRVIAEKWWGAHGPDIPHVMFSVSKSFTASAIGFAVDEGLLTLDDKVISFFPQHLPEEISPYLEQLRVWDLLTMSVGHDPAARIGRETEDWIAAFLNKPFVYEPGTHFHYDSDASFILSAIIQTLTG
ncbi:beta-lactamase family protein, partial [Bacteroidales bacterium OttesenSCG-928-L03]|nr:beta-lactamase family protein [Bacteroidales bacterium OttesenSCG-928-L03]